MEWLMRALGIGQGKRKLPANVQEALDTAEIAKVATDEARQANDSYWTEMSERVNADLKRAEAQARERRKR